jgi:hypothetical protein
MCNIVLGLVRLWKFRWVAKFSTIAFGVLKNKLWLEKSTPFDSRKTKFWVFFSLRFHWYLRWRGVSHCFLLCFCLLLCVLCCGSKFHLSCSPLNYVMTFIYFVQVLLNLWNFNFKIFCLSKRISTGGYNLGLVRTQALLLGEKRTNWASIF